MGKTYGEKPIVFRFEENGEEYMIGSEVLFNFFMNWDFPEVMFLSRNHNEGGGKLHPYSLHPAIDSWTAYFLNKKKNNFS